MPTLSSYQGESEKKAKKGKSIRGQTYNFRFLRHLIIIVDGWIYLRGKQACLRVPTLTPKANGDDYHYHLLMLYLPWRYEAVDLLGSHATTKQSFVSNNDRLLVTKLRLLLKLNELHVN